MAWKFAGSCCDNFIIDGVDIFTESWENTGERITVIDPLYGQKFMFTVWTIKKADKTLRFAAGEFSNSVYGIYLDKNNK